MRPSSLACSLLLLATASPAADLVKAKDGSGVYGYKDTPKLPWTGYVVHDADRESFGDFQLHLEWMAPAGFEGEWSDRGNSGVRLHGLYEIQIFDSYDERIYPDGQAAAVYGQTPPLVNATRPPGEWQTYDILFRAPVFEGEALVRPARVTVLHNGLLAQWDTEIHGETGHRVLPEYESRAARGPIELSGHNYPVRFRNVWIRPIGDAPPEGSARVASHGGSLARRRGTALVLEWALLHRQELRRDWEPARSGQTPEPVAPLE